MARQEEGRMWWASGSDGRVEEIVKSEKKMFRVKKWIHDNDLEDTLNAMLEERYVPTEVFRNTPTEKGVETTTIVFRYVGGR